MGYFIYKNYIITITNALYEETMVITKTNTYKSFHVSTLLMFQEDFRQWEMCKRELKKPDLTYHPPDAKFDGHTTFQDDFLPRGLAPRQSFKPSSIPKISDTPFDGVTSNQQCYVSHPLEARWVKVPEPYKPSSQPLQDLTTNRRDYQGLPGQLPQSYKPNPGKVTLCLMTSH